ncbi:hypothetical protein K7472_24870 [Streptomyces sp. PTM05]|uniref:Uncharacterized protein n=1 Tax=Streptantibioticus parmotrematis TaxID=2873249 RepID=A0ABS7QYP0_9ACTN|nr:hypothetical protein [Streptantibioticus parmotrematis]MBY8888048.1 hypothetical protein [Streptantibioticus parmotrematis]
MSVTWTGGVLAVVDDDHDRLYASDRHSRFGAYLRQEAGHLTSPDEPLTAEEFAAVVWRIATEPVMSPGYVRIRPDVRAVVPAWDENGEGLLFDVHVPLPHQALANARAVPARWRDWRTEPVFVEPEHRWWAEPDADRPALLTTTVIRLPVGDDWGLPEPGELHPGHELTVAAKQSVAAAAAGINRHAGPLLAALRTPGRNPWAS